MKKKLSKIVVSVFLILLTCNTFASNVVTEEELMSVADPGTDPGGTPIDSYIIPTLFLGIVIGCIVLRKKMKEVN